MSCDNAGNIRIEPVNVKWEIEQQDCIKVTSGADDLDGKYFLLGADKYVWFNLDAGSVDPSPASKTGIEVAVTTGQTPSAVATATQTAIDADLDYTATVDSTVIAVKRLDTLEVDAATDVDTGFTFHVASEGGSLDLGLLQGNVETTFEEQVLDVTAHQSGTTVIDALRQGVSAEISLVMQEASDLDKLKELFSLTGGGTVKPLGGTEVFGWGTSRQGDSVLPQSRRLNLHPVNAVGDLSRDITFWKAYPLPESLVISGEETKTLSLSFRLFLDKGKKSQVSLFCFGDYTQDLDI